MTDEDILQIKEDAQNVLLDYPGVEAVALGRKIKANKLAEGLAIAVFVKKKKAKSELTSKEVIPSKIKGVKTDVIEIGTIVQDQLQDEEWDPPPQEDAIMGGIRIEATYLSPNPDEKSLKNTIGFIATRDSDDKVVLVTTYHAVLRTWPTTSQGPHAVLTHPLKVDVGHPNVARGTSCSDDVVGEQVLSGRFTSTVDAAIVELVRNDNEYYRGDIKGINNGSNIAVNGWYIPSPTEIANGFRVRMYGATSGYHEAYVTHIAATGRCMRDVYDYFQRRPGSTWVKDDPVRIRNFEQSICVATWPPTTDPFSLPGDSGAAYIDDENRIVGIHFGSTRDTDNNPGNIGFGSRIDNILSELQITPFMPEQVNEDELIPREWSGSSASTSDSFNATLSPAISKMRRKVVFDLEQTALGSTFLGLINRHYKEILSLLNSNRNVTVKWHRLGGPSIMHSLTRSVFYPNKSLPLEIKGEAWGTTMEEVFKLFLEYGSEGLRNDVLNYRTPICELGGKSYNDIIQKIDSLNAQHIHHVQ